ncbi:hypothetical protein NDU88_004082 [Pleurodeles waltl]|uniref:Uncharacterized protein n=1 Tax=Pleurodeles waltl TaxID=8319 RepID=A0AAV7NIT6_PLEWA|nr:hypothetical protein NDU88_004082 [Pleurodeles waltl]
MQTRSRTIPERTTRLCILALSPLAAAHQPTLEMPSGKYGSKPLSKPAQQLLFKEDLLHSPLMVATKVLSISSWDDDSVEPLPDTSMDRICQEITSVGHRLERMDSNISALMAETKSIHTDIAGFQNCVTDLQHCISVAEEHLNTLPERDRELLFLYSKVIDLEDGSCNDNIHFFGLPECAEGSDIKGFLKNILPAFTGHTF